MLFLFFYFRFCLKYNILTFLLFYFIRLYNLICTAVCPFNLLCSVKVGDEHTAEEKKSYHLFLSYLDHREKTPLLLCV